LKVDTNDPPPVDTLVEVLLVLTGKVLVRVSTLGSWRCESIRGKDLPGADGALIFAENDRWVVTVAGQELVGIAFYAVVLGVVIALMLAP
jgi:hypothetical protein